MFLDSWSASDLRKIEASLPQGELRKRLEQYISETPLVDFVDETLSRELADADRYDSSSPDAIPLTEVDGYEDAKAVADRLVRDFESLPWEYMVSIPLKNKFGEVLSKEIKEFKLSDSVRLVAPDEHFRKAFPDKKAVEKTKPSSIVSVALRQFEDLASGWGQTATYLQVRVRGFVGYYGATAPVREAIGSMKTFCGLGIALGLLTRSYAYGRRAVRTKCGIHRLLEKKWVMERHHELKTDASAVLEDLRLARRDGNLSDEERRSWLEERLARIGSVFVHRNRAEKIVLASQWLFDSYCGDNELLSFVQTMVAMEILLGDKATSDAVGLGELLSNRCAYLIGKSQRARERILEEFRVIYDVRSQIVHRGKSRLSKREHELFSTFRDMCHQVIEEEVNLVRADIAQELAIRSVLIAKKPTAE
jgi:hypothetical protein